MNDDKRKMRTSPKKGDKIGKFEILEELEEGGRGFLYKARFERQMAVLKVVAPEIAPEYDFQKRFLREAKVIRSLDHPNIVRALDFGWDSTWEKYFVALELIGGEDLKKRLMRQGRLPVAQALQIVWEINEALQHLYEKELVHRDIKPDNILISRDGSVKLVDFGLVKILGSNLTGTGSILGTLLYMAPEMVISPKSADIRTDIYSLGITLFHMLAGQPPFYHKNPMTLIKLQCNSPLPSVQDFNPSAPKEVSSLLSRMTQKDPQNRFEKPEDLKQYLELIQKHLKNPYQYNPGSKETAFSEKGPDQLEPNTTKTLEKKTSAHLLLPEIFHLRKQLLQSGLASEDQLNSLFSMEPITSLRHFLALLFNCGITTEKALLKVLGLQNQMEVFSLRNLEIPQDVLTLIPSELTTRYGCVPVKREEDSLLLAMQVPLDSKIIQEFQSLTGLTIKGILASGEAILKAQAQVSLLVCQHCHKAQQAEWVFCPFCGSSIKDSPPEVEEEALSFLVVEQIEGSHFLESLQKAFPQGKITRAHKMTKVIEKGTEEKPHAILLEVPFREFPIGEFCAKVRENPLTSLIPILVVLPTEDELLRKRAYLAGADRVLQSGLSPQELRVVMERLLRESRFSANSTNVENLITKSIVILGRLEDVHLHEIVQTIVRMGKTGILILNTPKGKGEIFFEEGALTNARIGGEQGETAFYKMLRWNTGNFRFRQVEVKEEPVIKADTMGILMEACRIMDEESQEE